jgi:hypothetical protein
MEQNKLKIPVSSALPPSSGCHRVQRSHAKPPAAGAKEASVPVLQQHQTQEDAKKMHGLSWLCYVHPTAPERSPRLLAPA